MRSETALRTRCCGDGMRVVETTRRQFDEMHLGTDGANGSSPDEDRFRCVLDPRRVKVHRTGFTGNRRSDGSARPLCHSLPRISQNFVWDSSTGSSVFVDEVGSPRV